MALCFCRIILPILVIVFAWVNVSWSNIALTIIGALLVIMGIKRDMCCCNPKKEAEKESQPS